MSTSVEICCMTCKFWRGEGQYKRKCWHTGKFTFVTERCKKWKERPDG